VVEVVDQHTEADLLALAVAGDDIPYCPTVEVAIAAVHFESVNYKAGI
jgi:hypothetical protein